MENSLKILDNQDDNQELSVVPGLTTGVFLKQKDIQNIYNCSRDDSNIIFNICKAKLFEDGSYLTTQKIIESAIDLWENKVISDIKKKLR